MKKIILIPDSFKGTMTSEKICTIMKETILQHLPDTSIVSIPVADGGEGSVDCFISALGGKKIFIQVQSAFGEKMECYYGLLNDGETAVIEMAACAGLPLAEGRLNPEITTTYGVGELILHAAERGAKHIILGLGGSATNDAGCGAAVAAGIRFLDDDARSFLPTGGTLKQISKIDFTGRNPLLDHVKITAMCDIDNPMYGQNGAAYIFAPQKGADADMVVRLDNGLKHLNQILIQETEQDFSKVPGGGAAGAMGVGMQAFFNASLKMGIETVLDIVDFDSLLSNTDLVFTGEGKIDHQSLRGKVVMGVSRRAQKQKVPVVAVVGMIGDNIEEAYQEGLTAVFSINTTAMDFSKSQFHSEENLKITMDNIVRFLISSKQ